MNNSVSSLKIVRELRHEPARVFSALTDPAKMKQWFAGLKDGHSKVTTDLRPGGKYVIEMIGEEKTSVTHGVYLEIVPPKKLVFTWSSACGKGVENSTVTIELSPTVQGTKLIITHELPEDAIPSHREGWTICFDNLDTFLVHELPAEAARG